MLNLKNSASLHSVGGILMDAKLQALAKLFVELLVVILPLGNLIKRFEALLNKVLLDHTQDLVLLQSPPSDCQRKISGTHDAFDKIQPLWYELVTIIHALLLCLKQFERRTAWHKKHHAKLKLAFHAGILH